MADLVYELLAKIGLDDREFQDKLRGVGQSIHNTAAEIEAKAEQLKKSMLTLTGAGAAALGAFAVDSVKTAAEFDTSMSKVAAISGATGDDLQALRDKAKEMGATTKFSASESADALTYMAMAGWKTSDMLDGIEGVMNLAAASGENLATTSDIVTDALTAFGMKAGDSGRFADILAAASSNANTNVSMLGESFKYAAPVAGALGISAEDTSIALGIMANAGIKASQSGTALRTGLTNLAKPTKQMQQYMDEYNISMKENSDGSINLRETMIDLREKLGGLSQAEQASAAAAIFGKEAMSGWLAIINASDGDFYKLAEAIYQSNGAAKEMATIMEDNLEGDIHKLKSAWEGFRIEIGERLTPAARQVIQWLTDLIGRADEIIPKVTAAAAAFATFSVAINMTSIIKQVTLAFQAFMALLVANPVALVVAGIVGAITYLWQTNEDFRNKVIEIWNAIKTSFQNFSDKIKERLTAMGFDFTSFKEVVSAIWNTLWEGIAAVVTTVFEAVSIVIQTALDVIIGIVDVFSGIFSGDWEKVWTGIKEITLAIWKVMKDGWNEFLEFFKKIADTVLGAFGTSWETVWGNVKTFFVNIWTAVTEFFKSGIENINKSFEFLKAAIDLVKQWFSEKIDGIKEAWAGFKDKVHEATESIKNAWNSLMEAAANAGEAIKKAWEGAKEWGRALIEKILSGITEKASELWNKAGEIAKNAIEGIKKAWETAKEIGAFLISLIVGGIIEKASDLWNKAVETAKNVKEGIGKAWENAKELGSKFLETIKSGIAEKASDLVSRVSETAKNAREGISKAWETAKTIGSNLISNVTTGIGEKASALLERASTTAKNVHDGISHTWENAKTLGSNLMERIQGGIGEKVSGLVTRASEVATSARDGISRTWENAKTIGSNFVSTLQGGVAEKASDFISTAGKTASNVKDSFSKTWENAKTLSANLMEQLKSGIADKASDLVTRAAELSKTTIEAFQKAWENAKQIAANFVAMLISGFSEKASALMEAVTKAAKSVYETFTKGWESAKTLGTNLMDRIGSGIGEKASAISEAVQKIVTSITEYFTKFAESAKNLGGGIALNLRNGFAEHVRDMYDVIRNMFSEIVNAMREMIEAARTWGADLMINFVNGIMERWNDLVERLNAMAQAVKDRLGFSEPKKGPLSNFHTYAPDMMELFAQGIKDNEGVVADAIGSTFDLRDQIGTGFGAGRVVGMGESRPVMGSGGSKNVTVILQLERTELGRVVYQLNEEETQRVGVKLAKGGNFA